MMGGMTEHEHPQQLSLLPSSDLPPRFRLDAETRRRGLRHVAEIRARLAARDAARREVELAAARRPIRPSAA